MDIRTYRTASPTAGTRRLASAVPAVVTATVLLLTGCGDGGTEPTEADTGVPINTGVADPAVSPTASDDPLTGSEP